MCAVQQKTAKKLVQTLSERISSKQTIIVAIIGLLSAVAVASIANLDKLHRTKLGDVEEIGYYEGRESIVDRAFLSAEDEILAQRDLAMQRGEAKTADALKQMVGRVRGGRERVHELHKRHLQAIQNGERLSASKIKTETNEVIWEVNTQLSSQVFGRKIDIWTPESREAIRFGKRTHTLTQLSFPIRRIPLYGKQGTINQSEVCKIEEIVIADSATKGDVLP